MNFRWRRAVPIAGIGVIAAGVVLIGLFHHAPSTPKMPVGQPHMFSSTSNAGAAAVSRVPPPNETNIFTWNGPSAPGRIVSPNRAATQIPAQGEPRSPPGKTSSGPNAVPAPELAGRFPALAHQVFVSVPQSGSEPDYFAKLGNLANGTPMPPAARHIPATADHLARAQADLNRDNLAGAIAEVQAISGPAGAIMQSWLADAKTRLAMARRHPRANTRVVQNSPPARTWPHIMPSEIPPYARESTGAQPP